MKLISKLSQLSMIVLAAATFACSGGGTGGTGSETADNGTNKTETASIEQQLHDANVKYAASVNADLATVEGKYKDLIGTQFPDAFSANFLKFVIETNPSFANAEANLQQLGGQFYLSMFTTRLVRGGGSDDAEDDVTEEQKAKMKDASDKFSAALSQSRDTLIQVAAIYNLTLTATDKDSFALPENYLGNKEIAASIKDFLTQPLYAASLKDKNGYYSFYELFARNEEESTSTIRTNREIDVKMGKYNYLPVAENIFKRPSSGGGLEEVRRLLP